MTPDDLRIFCSALGFMAVVLKGDEGQADKTQRALGFAKLIEAFCTYTSPFYGASVNENQDDDPDALIEKLKTDLRHKGEADMQKSRQTLFRLYDRLRLRYVAYATDDMVADRVLELLDAELANDASL